MSKFFGKCLSFQSILQPLTRQKSTGGSKGQGHKGHGANNDQLTIRNIPNIEKCQFDIKLRQSEAKFGLPSLKSKDRERRVLFAKSLLAILDKKPEILDSIIFSDEGNFWPERPQVLLGGGTERGGGLNKKRYFKKKMYAESSPLPTICWCGMTSKEVVGPYFFNSHVTGEPLSLP
jgi:hypothetical protein